MAEVSGVGGLNGLEKPSLETYSRWLQSVRPGDLAKERARFDQVVVKAETDIRESAFWNSLTSRLRDFDDQYTSLTTYKLVSSHEQYAPTLVRKSWGSFFEKTYRKNVLGNDRWPDAPVDGWITPDNWLERVNDIIRTTLVVKYLDGVEFLVEQISRVAVENGLDYRCDFEAKDAGYYAAHSYVTCEVDVPSMSWDTEKRQIQLELQVTTQLQDVIRRLTHKVYEGRRVADGLDPTVAWQWQYRSEEFVPNYLGHILHYLEGMIMDVRERQGGAAGARD